MKSRPLIRALVFDAYGTLFDVHSVRALAEQLFPQNGATLATLWRSKQLDYTRLRTMSNQYADFWQITRDALRYSARQLQLSLDEASEKQLMNQYACLAAFPENLAALRELQRTGLPLAILSNGTPTMLDVAVRSSGMHGLFSHIISTDSVRQYKTTHAAYALGPNTLNLPAREILFISSNGWDACGATWFGYTTFWVNRAGLPTEELGVSPSATGRTLTDVVDFVSLHLTTHAKELS